MPASTPDLEFSIHSSLKELSRNDWDTLFWPDAIEGYGYQKALEEANLEEFSFGYLTGKRDGQIKAIFPFFVMNFSLDMLISGPLHGLASFFKRFLTLKILFLGTPAAEEFYLGVAADEDINQLLDMALETLVGYCKKERIQGFLFYNISQKHPLLLEYLSKNRFIKMDGLPSTIIHIESRSLEEYISTLSRNTRKDLKRKFKRSQALSNLTTELREDIDDIIDEIYALYLNNFSDSDIRFEMLSREFFQKITRDMPGIAKFFITRDKERIVAFNLCFIKNTTCIDKFIGLDKPIAHEYHLYYTTFCHNIEWCIKNGIRFYQPGATDYHPKLRLGARLIPLVIYSKGINPLLHYTIKLIAPFIQPKNIDPSLKGT